MFLSLCVRSRGWLWVPLGTLNTFDQVLNQNSVVFVFGSKSMNKKCINKIMLTAKRKEKENMKKKKKSFQIQNSPFQLCVFFFSSYFARKTIEDIFFSAPIQSKDDLASRESRNEKNYQWNIYFKLRSKTKVHFYSVFFFLFDFISVLQWN